METHFERFYDRIKLGAAREARINDALDRLGGHIRNDELQAFLASAPVPQGSWAQGTIVNPPSDEPDFDVDVLVPMDFNRFPGEMRTSRDILDYVRKRLKRYYGATVKTRDKCVRIQYGASDGFHVDVVPAHVIDNSSGPFEICSKEFGFVRTNPLAMTAWVNELDQGTHGHFSRAIVCLKRWRDLKFGSSSAPKSILLTCLAGQAFTHYGGHSDLLTTRLATLEVQVHDLVVCMRAYLEAGPDRILIPGSSDDLYGPWPQQHHDVFLARLRTFEDRATRALAQRSVPYAVDHWRSQFGLMFPGSLA